MDDGTLTLAGDGLRVGAQGMRSFYDRIIPSVLGDVLKKSKAGKPQRIGVAGMGEQVGVWLDAELSQRIAGEGMPLFSRKSSPAQDAEVEALVAHYASVDGAPSEAQLRKAVQQYRDTERAYGGREAYDKAKADSKTKLNYRQWVQVRTPNFKRWFGDWEAANGALSRDASTFSDARAQAKAFQGKPMTNRATGIAATVSRNGLDKMLSGKAIGKSESAETHSRVVANLDSLFERALLGWSKPDRSEDPNIKAIHRFFAPATIDGRALMVKMTVKEVASETKPNPLYTVEAVSFAETENPAAQWVGEIANADGVDPRTIRSAGLIQSMAQGVRDFNSASASNIIDPQTGEPMVVYHATWSDFTGFDRGRAGENTDANASDEDYAQTARMGHWFSSADVADNMGAPIAMPAFLAIKDPKGMGSLRWLAERAIPFAGGPQELQAQLIAQGHGGLVVEDEEFGATSYVAFDADQIKSASANAGTFSNDTGDIRFSFGGKGAKGANLAALNRAKTLAARGRDMEQVRKDTGWHRGKDGKWRFEISDHDAKLKVDGATAGEVLSNALFDVELDGGTRVTVGDILDHPALFSAYPELANIPVNVAPKNVTARARIITTKRGQPVEVQLQARTARDSMASHLLHEIQHGIQSYEGFAGGGSKQNFISEADKTVLVRGISAACYLSAD